MNSNALLPNHDGITVHSVPSNVSDVRLVEPAVDGPRGYNLVARAHTVNHIMLNVCFFTDPTEGSIRGVTTHHPHCRHYLEHLIAAT